MFIKEIQKNSIQILKGVMFIHNQNYLHRDLKPANILITCNNKIKIIDFGLCVQLKSISGNRQKLCKKIGTKTYMSPEQVCFTVCCIK